MTTQAFVNVVLAFDKDRAAEVNQVLRDLSDCARGNGPIKEVDDALMGTQVLHFMSISVIEPACPHEIGTPAPKPDADAPAHLVFEMSVDGGRTAALRILTETMLSEVRRILRTARLVPDEPLEAYLRRHTRRIGAHWWQTLGQVHGGSPGMSVMRIRAEKVVASQIASDIQNWQIRRNPRWTNGSARQRLDMVRNTLWERQGFKWAFVPEAAPLLAPSPDQKWKTKPVLLNPGYYRAAASIFNTLLWPLYLPVLLFAAFVVWKIDHYHWTAVGAFALFVAAVSVASFLWCLSRREKNDPEDDRTPDAAHVERLLDRENYCAQNLLASTSRLKKGWIRAITLRFAFAMVGTGRFVGRPGFLGRNGVIHFARWMRLPGTDQLLFFSNYSGTWDSYVGDFIADAPTGVTAIWSNCTGFPRTTRLLGGGAARRNQLVRWARRQQHQVHFWFSAYPNLTAERIRINAAIRQGLATAQTEADAVDWLSLFGSAPRPGTTLQVTEIPTLVFGGLSTLRYASCHTVSFMENDTARCKEWLALAGEQATYGEMLPGQTKAVVVALTRRGLERLGVPPDSIETFPPPFKHGMWRPGRARQLGDVGGNAPTKWDWGAPARHGDEKAYDEAGKEDPDIDVLVLFYGKEQEDLEGVEHLLLDKAWACGHTHKLVVDLAMLEDKARPGVGVRAKEPFGFEDGVSQPIIKGSPRAPLRSGPYDVIEPGEIVLGYPDNLGHMPPSPTLDAGLDPLHLLPDVGPDPHRQRPEFSVFEGTGQRNLGANGTFLVVRQLEQDVTEFDRWIRETVAKQLAEGRGGSISVERWSASTNGAQPRPYVMQAGQPSASGRSKSRTVSYDPKSVEELATDKGFKEYIGAKLIGRWHDGTSTVRFREQSGIAYDPPAKPDNDFLFGVEDASALACPFGAHIRRANPRDTRYPGSAEEIATVNRHRMLRVGRVYGEASGSGNGLDPKAKRGLLFMCLNADIDRQFEFVQKTWLLNPHLHGLDGEVDPILGQGPKNFTIPTPTGPVRLRHMPTIVTVKGGGYFFVPGRGALRYLARSDS